MITWQRPPSALLGSMAASIDTPSFRCFVSTARNSLFSRQFSVLIHEGEATLRRTERDAAKVLYTPSLSREDRIVIHQRIVDTLNQLGESGIPFEQAVNSVLSDLLAEGLIEPPD